MDDSCSTPRWVTAGAPHSTLTPSGQDRRGPDSSYYRPACDRGRRWSTEPNTGARSTREVLITMKKYLLTAASFAALAIVVAQPAGAATPTSFTLTPGTLSISAPTTSVSIGSQVVSASPSTISGQLGDVTVSDLRGGATTWTASVISTAFTPTAGPADPASNVSYAAGPITSSATVVATPTSATNLTGVVPIMSGASTGVSSATWDPTISVFVPANFAPGVYVATITHSVA